MPLIELSFASGEESLSVRRFVIHEKMSAPFHASVWARSPNEDITFGTLTEWIPIAVIVDAGSCMGSIELYQLPSRTMSPLASQACQTCDIHGPPASPSQLPCPALRLEGADPVGKIRFCHLSSLRGRL
jgi:hypothetical protein